MNKELEALNELKYQCVNYQECCDLFDTIETALKALEIIKEKRVNVGALLMSSDCETYNDISYSGEENKLTQEEYDLLKEVLL